MTPEPNYYARVAGMAPGLRAKAEDIGKTLADIAAVARKAWRPAVRLRLGPFAIVLRVGLHGAGWSQAWWRLWRYREADERTFLEAHAAVWGLSTLPGESVAALRGRLSDHVRNLNRKVTEDDREIHRQFARDALEHMNGKRSEP